MTPAEKARALEEETINKMAALATILTPRGRARLIGELARILLNPPADRLPAVLAESEAAKSNLETWFARARARA